MKFVLPTLLIFGIATTSKCEIHSGRMRGDDEPHMVSWRVLEGVIEPFDSFRPSEIPLWKQMKNSADQKAANMMLQHALKEYGQLLRHWHFGEMPMEERYDVFLSMSKLLKMMGFHQRAELLLYEAMSYTTSPYEAHLQLALLFLDKEDLENAKVHLKNCLFFRDNDLLILSQLAVVLIAEGKLHEAKFFLSRLLSGLETRVSRLTSLLNTSQKTSTTSSSSSSSSSSSTSSHTENNKKHTDISENIAVAVDMESITARVDFMTLSRWTEQLFSKTFHGEFRLGPSATMNLMKMFSNLYRWMSEGELSGRFVFDLGQSLYEAGRPNVGRMMMQRGFETSDAAAEGVVSTEVVKMRLAMDYPVVPGSVLEILESYLNMTNYLAATASVFTPVDVENVMDVYWPLPLLWWSGLPVMPVISEVMWRFEGGPDRTDDISRIWLSGEMISPCSKRKNGFNSGIGAGVGVEGSEKSNNVVKSTSKGYFDSITSMLTGSGTGTGSESGKRDSEGDVEDKNGSPETIEIGIMGGHMNDHPVGHMVLHRLLGIVDAISKGGQSTGSSSSSSKNSKSSSSSTVANKYIPVLRVTLIAYPLMPDDVTKRIAKRVSRIVNLPMDTASAWQLLEQLHLDVLLFPDDQPFPDQQSSLFQSRRIAPVQACFYVRGSSCASDAIDYYLLPAEHSDYYLNGVPAADTASVNTVEVSDKDGKNKTMKVKLRPPWLELYSEQVIVLDWPVLTPSVVQEMAKFIHVTATAATADGTGSSASTGSGSTASGHDSGSHLKSSSDIEVANLLSGSFPPLEVEGQVFYEGQPVAVIPLHPSALHPLMDDIIFKIMRTAPLLQVVLALPASLYSHVTDIKHKMNWARKVVRRLWAGGGNLYQRIRLLPTPLSDVRMLKLLRQADLVLDTVPVGTSMDLLAMAISVGTPVVTLKTGTVMNTPREDLQELRVHLQLLLQAQLLQQRGEAQQETASQPTGGAHLTIGVGAAAGTKRRLDLNPMFRRLALGGSDSASGMSNNNYSALNVTQRTSDIPWSPSISIVAGYYERTSTEVAQLLVANSTVEYVKMASLLALDRELSYNLRVKLLDIIDSSSPGTTAGGATAGSGVFSSSGSSGLNSYDGSQTGSGSGSSSRSSNKNPDISAVSGYEDLLDMAQFLEMVGKPWALLREDNQKCLGSNSKLNRRGAGYNHRKGAILS